MPNARQQLERVITQFTDDLVEVIQMVVAEALTEAGTPPRREAARRRRGAGPAAGRRRGRRGSAGDVEERILQELERAGESLAVSDLEARTRLPRSSLVYSLRKLKAAGRVRQEGERRFARYRLAR